MICRASSVFVNKSRKETKSFVPLKCMYIDALYYMRERLTTTHCCSHIIIRRFTILYIYIYTYKDFAGGGTLGRRPTINLPTFFRGRRSRAFPASIIPYATGSVPPFTVHIYIYISQPVISRRISQKQRPSMVAYIQVPRRVFGRSTSRSATGRAFICSPRTSHRIGTYYTCVCVLYRVCLLQTAFFPRRRVCSRIVVYRSLVTLLRGFLPRDLKLEALDEIRRLLQVLTPARTTYILKM